MDGYDKLKPYGFPIHGAVDGYSRRVLWLKVGCSNNNPVLIAKYFCEAAMTVKAIPCVLRADRGTENGHVRHIQVYFRSQHDDPLSGESSFVYGKSTGNQRIESFWGQLRRLCVQFWMNLFKDMVSRGLLDTSDKVDILAMRYCYIHLIRRDLDRMANEWNVHPIRPNNAETQCGRPNMMYFSPETFGACTYRKEFTCADMETFRETLDDIQDFPDQSATFVQFVHQLIGNHDLPTSAREATALFERIKREIGRLDNPNH